ncbi:protein SMG7-like [Patiria miniata]|uniref:Protein SMG7 n=1 Tax=Patiria miniata TaxID=46514 RepID=A0A914AK95_PATMI|nr:protein SMG7-like [Patiria miniata]
MFCEQLLRKANERKAEIIEGRGDPWVTRQQLRELYQQILVTDLEYALDKKVEQDLWNHAFKNQISALQRKAKDKTNPKRSEVQAMLTLFLDSGSGFYLQLLHELCSSFQLDIPCCVRAPRLGMASELILPASVGQHKVATPAYASVLYICQHCLVHLGDLARYRNETNQSESYYLQAAHLVPSNGQPYNQLAIVAASKGDQLAMTFYYIRSIAVKHPFPAAATNLQTTFSKLVDRDEVKLFKMKEIELIHFFIKFHAIVYLAAGDQDLQIASAIKEKLEENFRSHLAQETLTAQQLVQIASINLFALHCVCLRQLETLEGGVTSSQAETVKGSQGDGQAAVQDGCYAADETRTWNLVFGLTITLLQLMLHYTPGKTDGKPLQWCGLPAVKVLLDWLVQQPSLFQDPFMSAKSVLWGKFARVLNSIQTDASSSPKHSRVPLPEDISLNGFLPLQDAQGSVEFTAIQQSLTKETQWAERAKRLLAHGRLVAETHPDHLKTEPSSEGTTKVTFTSQSGEEQTRRLHHPKQKQSKTSHQQQQQQQRQSKHQQIQAAQGSTPNRGGAKKARDGPKKRDSSTEPAIGERGALKGSGGGRKGSDGSIENKTHSVAIQAILPRPSQSKVSETASKATEPIPIPGNAHNRPADGRVLQEQNPIHSPIQAQGRQHPYHSPTHSPSSGFRHPVGQPLRHHPPPPWPNQPHGPPPYPQHVPPHPGGLPHPPPPSGHHVPPYPPVPRGPHPPGPPPPHPGVQPPHLQQGPAHPQRPPPHPHSVPPNLQQHPQGPQPSHPPGPPPTMQGPPSSGPPSHGLPPHMPPSQGPRPNFPRAPMHQRPPYPHGEKSNPMWQQQQPQDQDGASGYEFSHQQPPPQPQQPTQPHPHANQGLWPKGPAVSSSADSSPSPTWGGNANKILSQSRGPVGRQNPMQQQQQQAQLPYIQHPDQALPLQQHPQGAKSDPFQRQQQQQQQQQRDSFSAPSGQPSQPNQDLAQQFINQNTLNQNILELLSTLQKQMQQSPDPGDGNLGLKQQLGSSLTGNSLDSQSLSLLSQLNQHSASQGDIQSQRFLGSSLNKDQFASMKQPSPVQKPFQSAFSSTRSFDASDLAKNSSNFPFQGDDSTPYRSPQHLPYSQHGPEHKSQGYPSNFEDLQIKEPSGLFRSSPSSHLQQQQQQRLPPDWSIEDGSDGRGTPTSPPTLFPSNEEVRKMQKMPGFSTWPDQFSMEEYQTQRTRDVPTLLNPATSSGSLGLSPTPSSQPTRQSSSFLGQDAFGSSQPTSRRYNNGGSGLFSDSTERKSSLEDGTLGTSSGYSLFSYSSPWAGGKQDGHNLNPSPFSSSPSSPRSQSPSVQSKNQLGGGLGGGLGWGTERSGTTGAWSSHPTRGHQLSSSPTSGLLPDSIQSIWSSPLGSSAHKPSPLEELLKRQKMTDQR